MDEKKVSEIVKAGESQAMEFKRTSTKDAGKTICAFANASGGTLLIGVEDEGTIVGVPPKNRMRHSNSCTIRNKSAAPLQSVQ